MLQNLDQFTYDFSVIINKNVWNDMCLLDTCIKKQNEIYFDLHSFGTS